MRFQWLICCTKVGLLDDEEDELDSEDDKTGNRKQQDPDDT